MSEKENINYTDIFDQLRQKALEIYPDIDNSIMISQTFDLKNVEISSYMSLITMSPVTQISTNQFIL